jgi:3-oxoacyl-[acyl-carrier-protein] synthase III
MSRAAVVAGLGSWCPPRVVTNAELSSILDTSDEWIRSRTGIGRRHVVDPGMATADLATEAARRALKSASADRVDAVVLATTTPDRPCPATAPEVASRLGLTGVAAFDVAAVCSGFLYGLATGAGLIGSGVADRVLVIGAEAFSTILDPADRTTRAVFGDGAGAVVLRAGAEDDLGAVRAFDLGSDGDLADLIAVPAGGSRQRSTGRAAAESEHYFAMDGKRVFKHAVVRMTASVEATLAKAGLKVGDLDHLVAHQANARILAAVAERAGIPADRMVSNIELVGNTAAASVPLALAHASASGRLRTGQLVLLTAFGGGLAWGSCLLRWPAITTA